MPRSLIRTLREGVRQFTEHPQLFLTLLVAVSILCSYLFLAERFISIATDAQDRLINVRVGAMQDAFAPLAGELLSSPDVLREHMKTIASQNQTIVEFSILEEVAPQTWYTIVSLNKEEEYLPHEGYGIVLGLASNDPGNSYTTQEYEGSERYFRTARAIVKDGEIQGVIVTRQSLSEADLQIAKSIRDASIMLGVVLLFLMGLFFKHARIIDYTVLYKKLKELDQLKDDFISMTSHELRTPLTAIRGYVELLEQKDEVRTVDGKQFLERINTSAEELDQLISDILDVTRLEQGRLSFTPTTIDPKSIMEEVVSSLMFKAKEKGLVLKTLFEHQATIVADPVRLKQVMVNIIGNAVKYTKKGEIVARVYSNNNRLYLRVSDTGIGMSAEAQRRLFEKFYRADSSEVQREVGTGLGLWITKQLVEKMGGTISVESIEGVGSHIVVSFPLVNE